MTTRHLTFAELFELADRIFAGEEVEGAEDLIRHEVQSSPATRTQVGSRNRFFKFAAKCLHISQMLDRYALLRMPLSEITAYPSAVVGLWQTMWQDVPPPVMRPSVPGPLQISYCRRLGWRDHHLQTAEELRALESVGRVYAGLDGDYDIRSGSQLRPGRTQNKPCEPVHQACVTLLDQVIKTEMLLDGAHLRARATKLLASRKAEDRALLPKMQQLVSVIDAAGAAAASLPSNTDEVPQNITPRKATTPTLDAPPKQRLLTPKAISGAELTLLAPSDSLHLATGRKRTREQDGAPPKRLKLKTAGSFGSRHGD
ncbi:hypothetical protein LTR15_005582 [Elasticomyces elasticus]|nr:hypothetical protein LTR15_005582 [Elasticomyces elasticus]